MPSKRELNPELDAILAKYPELVGVLGETAANQGAMLGKANAANSTALLRGQFDAGYFDSKNPGFLDEYNKLQAAGELKGWTPADFAAAYIGKPNNDPALYEYYNGGVLDTINQASTALGETQAAANTAQRTADIKDVATLGGQAIAAYDAANPGLATAKQTLLGGITGANVTGAPVADIAYNPVNTPYAASGQAQPAAAVTGDYKMPVGYLDGGGGIPVNAPGYANGQYAGMPPAGGASGGMLGAPATPTYAAPTNNWADQFAAQGKELSGTALTPLQQEMQRQAMAELQLGGKLGAGEQRDIAQAIGSRYSSRGLGYSPAAAAAELLGTDAAQRQRLNERRAFAGAVDSAGFAQQTTNRNLGLGYAQQANSAQQQAGQLGLGYAGLNENARQFGGQLGLGYAQLGQQDRQFGAQLGQQDRQFGAQLGQQDRQFGASLNQQGRQFDAGNTLQTSMFNAQRQDQRLATDRAYSLGATQMLGGLSQDPYAMVLGRSNGIAQAGGAINMATGYTPDTTGALGQLLGYGQDVFDSNVNAQNASDIASKNRTAALWGSFMSMIGAAIPG